MTAQQTGPPRVSLSSRARQGESSAIRDLLEQANRPGMISLAGGLPDPTRFPVAELGEIASRVIAANGERALQYGPTPGLDVARSALATLFDPHVDADDIVVTTGSQQGLDLIARVLLDPGDGVVVSDPDYLGAVQSLRGSGAEFHPIPIDADGFDTQVLADRLRWGLRPKACYLVPHFHNPTGASMSTERRSHLDELSLRYGFVVIEDDPYREVYYDGAKPQADVPHELTVRLRSTSKILAPGLRIGAMAGPRWLTDAVVIAKQAVDLHTSTVPQLMVAEALQADWLAAHVDGLRTTYAAKRAALVSALRRDLGNRVEFATPAGGMFLWVRFGDGVDTAALLNRCLDRGMCFVPGQAFSVERDLSAHARFSFVTASLDELDEAVGRLAAALAGC